MLENLTKAIFETHLNETFFLDLDGSGQLSLELTQVSGLNTSGIRQEAFSLIFRAPHHPSLPQRMYNLEHERMGKLEMVFLVPIAEDRSGRYYEAVFN